MAPTYACLCTCGGITIVPGYKLKRGDTSSCGCLRRERSATRHAIHWHTSRRIKETVTYRSWRAMKARCQNPKDKFFHRYGGRGILVYEPWNEFATFLRDMGPKPSPKHSIDRFPDNDGNYEPGNCRWATAKEQAANRPGRTGQRKTSHDGLGVADPAPGNR